MSLVNACLEVKCKKKIALLATDSQYPTLCDELTEKKEFVRVSELCFPQCGGCVCVEVKIGFLSLLIRWRLPGMFNVLLTYY